MKGIARKHEPGRRDRRCVHEIATDHEQPPARPRAARSRGSAPEHRPPADGAEIGDVDQRAERAERQLQRERDQVVVPTTRRGGPRRGGTRGVRRDPGCPSCARTPLNHRAERAEHVEHRRARPARGPCWRDRHATVRSTARPIGRRASRDRTTASTSAAAIERCEEKRDVLRRESCEHRATRRSASHRCDPRGGARYPCILFPGHRERP